VSYAHETPAEGRLTGCCGQRWQGYSLFA
jgi:hypothetical protein